MMKVDSSFYHILITPVRRSFIALRQFLEAMLCTSLDTLRRLKRVSSVEEIIVIQTSNPDGSIYGTIISTIQDKNV